MVLPSIFGAAQARLGMACVRSVTYAQPFNHKLDIIHRICIV